MYAHMRELFDCKSSVVHRNHHTVIGILLPFSTYVQSLAIHTSGRCVCPDRCNIPVCQLDLVPVDTTAPLSPSSWRVLQSRGGGKRGKPLSLAH